MAGLRSPIDVVAEEDDRRRAPAGVVADPVQELGEKVVAAVDVPAGICRLFDPHGSEAADAGMILECVPDSELEQRAAALAQRMARLPLNQLQMMKWMLNDVARLLRLALRTLSKA